MTKLNKYTGCICYSLLYFIYIHSPCLFGSLHPLYTWYYGKFKILHIVLNRSYYLSISHFLVLVVYFLENCCVWAWSSSAHWHSYCNLVYVLLLTLHKATNMLHEEFNSCCQCCPLQVSWLMWILPDWLISIWVWCIYYPWRKMQSCVPRPRAKRLMCIREVKYVILHPADW